MSRGWMRSWRRPMCWFGIHDWWPNLQRYLAYGNDVVEYVDGSVCSRCGKIDRNRDSQ